jgi:hypothetical protein
MMATTNTSEEAFVTIAHRNGPQRGNLYFTDKAGPNPKTKDSHDTKRFATTSRCGQLQLKRTGSEIHFCVSEGADSELRELRPCPFVAAPLNKIRITADTGNALGKLDLRLTDFTIRTSPSTGDPSGESATGSALGVITALSTAVVVVLGGALTWLELRRRKPKPAP